jgi:hypothetical protein
MVVPAGTTMVGTARVRADALPKMTAAQMAVYKATGNLPAPSAGFDDIADGIDAPPVAPPIYRKPLDSPRDAAKKALHALGRLRDGEENATERRYAAHLERLKQAGEIRWYLFEGIKLKLAPKTFLTVDYAVMSATGQLEMHDVKGARAIFSDDAKVKMKVAADKFPFVFKVAFPKKGSAGGGFEVEEI